MNNLGMFYGKITRYYFKPNQKVIRILKWLIPFSLFFIFCFYGLDSDFGWHLKSGLIYLEKGLPSHDIFTYTAADFRWINHEWFSEVIFAILYKMGGYLLISLVYAFLWTATINLLTKKVRLSIILLASIALIPYMGVRQLVWTQLFFVGLIYLTKNYHRRLWQIIPLYFIVWTNLHGGFVLGFGYLIYLAMTRRQTIWLKILILAFLASLISPYGFRIYPELISILGDSSLRFQISEWFPFQIWHQNVAFLAIWLSGFLWFSIKKIENYFRMDFIMLLAAMSSSRNMALFVTIAIPYTDGYISQLLPLIPQKLNIIKKVILFVVVFVIFGYATYGLLISGTRISNNLRGSLSVTSEGITYLKQNPCPGRVLNDFNLGGLIRWQYPELPVYIDGRMPSWRGPDGRKYLDNYYRLINDGDFMNQQIKQFNIKCVILESSYGLYNKLHLRLQEQNWRMLVFKNSVIYLEPKY